MLGSIPSDRLTSTGRNGLSIGVVGSRSFLTALLGVIGCAAVLLSLAGNANAAFSIAKCEGDNIVGRGASFQAQAQVGWANVFLSDRVDGCFGYTPVANVSYEGLGSGSGRTAMGQTGGVRSAVARYAGTDEAPTATQQSNMNAGIAANPNDNGQVHVIPVATASNTMIVNFPDNCELPVGDSDRTTYARFAVPNARLEQFWRGDSTMDEWGELLPGIQAIPGNAAGKTDEQCEDQQARRVVRLDSSGTTFSFKQYLKAVNPGFDWQEPVLTNQAWPNNITGSPTEVLRGASNGNGPLTQRVKTNDGTIGYSDLATSRNNGFRKRPDANGEYSFNRGLFWIPLQNSDVTDGYVEPTITPDAIETGVRGSNCDGVRYSNVPGDVAGPVDNINTFGNWSTVGGVMYTEGYAICTLTYVLAWDDYADVYGNTPVEEAKARTVKDFLRSIVTPGGQIVLVENDYNALPTDINQNLAGAAVQAVNSIDWNKP